MSRKQKRFIYVQSDNEVIYYDFYTTKNDWLSSNDDRPGTYEFYLSDIFIRKIWYYENNYHRTSGPAVVYSDGDVDYYLHGRLFSSKEEWEKERLEFL